jgi:hypothetical protein
MKPATALMIFSAATGALLLTGCADVSPKANLQVDSPRFSHSREITNPYLPLASLKQDILENQNERVERTAKPEIHKTFQIGGQTVEALTVEDREYASASKSPARALDNFMPGGGKFAPDHGELTEVTLDYFAQDDDGNVFYLGEDVDEYKNGKVTGHSGAWLYGKNTKQLGLLMPGHPKTGDTFKSEDVPKITWEQDEVVSVSETVTVPAGTFQNCVKIKETASDGGTEIKFYAPGVGCIEEVESRVGLPLQSHSTK